MIEEIDPDVFPESIVLQFSIDKKSNEYTDNNIVVIFRDSNSETEIESCMWIDRDSQKIIGLFAKGEKPHKNVNEEEKSDTTTKKKLAPKQKKPEDAEEEK